MAEGTWIGDGSLREVKSGRHKGKWRLQWKIVEPGELAATPIDKLFATRSAGNRWREAEKRRLLAGSPNVRGRQGATLSDAWETFAGTKEAKWADGVWVRDGSAPSGVETKAARWRKWVAGTDLELTPIKSLTREDARTHVEGMREGGATLGTRRDVVGLLAKLYDDHARETRGFDGANPFRRLPLTTAKEKASLGGEPKESPSLLTPTQVKAALKANLEPRQRAMVALFLLSGIRRSEAMELAFEQFDFARGVIVLDRAAKFGPTGRPEPGLPKGNKTRLVCLCPTLGRIVQEYAATCPAGHLFGNAQGEIQWRKPFYAEWRAAAKAAKIGGTTPKVCRASHNNALEKLARGVSESARLEHMGHSLRGASEGRALGIVVNVRNYTGFIPEGYAPLRREIERILC